MVKKEGGANRAYAADASYLNLLNSLYLGETQLLCETNYVLEK